MLEQNEVRHIDIHIWHRHHPQILKRNSFHFRIPDSCTPPFQHDSSNTGYCKPWTLDRFWACISFSAEKIIWSYELVQSGHEAVVQGPTGDLLEHGTAWRQSVFWILKSSKWASKILNASLRSPREHVDLGSEESFSSHLFALCPHFGLWYQSLFLCGCKQRVQGLRDEFRRAAALARPQRLLG